VRVPPGEGGKDNFRRDPFMTVIGAETFPMHCGKAGPATCRYQTDAMWLAEAKAHAQSGTSH
jgi:hypothetical protein